MFCSVLLCLLLVLSCFMLMASLPAAFCYSLKSLSFLGFLVLPFDVTLESFKYVFVCCLGSFCMMDVEE